MEEIARLIRCLGLEVNTFFNPDQTFENIQSAPSAALNFILSRVWGVDFSGRFEHRHGTTYQVTDLPIGPEASDQFVRELSGLGHVSVDISPGEFFSIVGASVCTE